MILVRIFFNFFSRFLIFALLVKRNLKNYHNIFQYQILDIEIATDIQKERKKYVLTNPLNFCT